MRPSEAAAVDLITDPGRVVITDELTSRPARLPDYDLERRAMSALMEELAARPATVLQRLCDLLVELRIAQTAGVSLHEAEGHRLRWVAVAGEWAPHLGGVMPFGASPCGAVIKRNEPMLFARPHEHFPAANAEPLIREVLLVPFRSDDRAVGTLWVLAHDETNRFDAEDLRLLTSLAHVASAAYRTTQMLAEREESRNLLQATMDASTDLIQVFAAIRDASGEIVDFRWMLNNHTSEGRYGKIGGESLLERNPGVVIEGIFDDFKHVTETGEPVQKERHYVHEQFDGWFYQSVVKLGDGVATTTKDITDWKRAQADVLRLQDEVAQAKLRESEEKFRVLFNSIDEGLAIVEMIYDADGAIADMVVRQVNSAYQRQGGLEDVVGRSLSEMPPGVEEVWLDRCRHVATTGEPLRIEHHRQDVDRWFNVYSSRLDTAGRFVAIVFTDISERKRAEGELRKRQERQTFLLRFSDALRGDDDADAVANRAIAMLADELRLDRCYIATYRSEDDAADLAYQIGKASMPPLPATVALSHCFEARDQFRHGTFVLNDAHQRQGLSAAEKSESQALGMRAMVAATARGSDKNLLTSLVAVSSRPRAWTAGEIALVEEIAERTWAAMERARVAAALRESEARLTAAFASVPVGAAVLDMSGKVVIANAEYRRFLPSGLMPSRNPEIAADWRAWDITGGLLALDDFPGARALKGESVVPGQEMVFTDGHGREVWTSVATTPTHDEHGRVTGAVSIISDIDVAKRSSEALRRSEERLRQFGEASQDILWIRDAETLQWQYLTSAFEHIYGVSREEALTGNNYRSWLDLIVPDDRLLATEAMERVRAGEQVAFEYRVRRPVDGSIRWLRSTDFPIVDEQGDVKLIGGIGHDLTDLREAELRLKALVEGIPQLVWRASKPGRWTWASPQWTRFTRQPEEDSHGWGWLEPLHPDDREQVREAWALAGERGRWEAEFRICVGGAGTYRWFQARAEPVRDEVGEIIEWLGTSTDVDELRKLQGRQQILLAELQHRVRNILAVTRSMISRSDDGERPIEDYVQHLQGRMAALARTQVLLTRSAGTTIDLESMFRDELLVQAADEGQISLQGEEIAISPKSAEVLTLAIHELATNATKYGAFSRSSGRLEVRWRSEVRDGQAWLVIDWRERGVPIIDMVPRRQGFGSELLSRRIPYELKGHGSFSLKPGGVESRIEFPLLAGESILQTDAGGR